MTEHQGIPDGHAMVEIYDPLLDDMVLAPKSLADRAELLKNAWAAGADKDAGGWPIPSSGDPVLFQKALDAARELRAAFIASPRDLPVPKRRRMLKPESLDAHHKRHARARKRGPKET